MVLNPLWFAYAPYSLHFCVLCNVSIDILMFIPNPFFFYFTWLSEPCWYHFARLKDLRCNTFIPYCPCSAAGQTLPQMPLYCALVYVLDVSLTLLYKVFPKFWRLLDAYSLFFPPLGFWYKVTNIKAKCNILCFASSFESHHTLKGGFSDFICVNKWNFKLLVFSCMLMLSGI